jgi:pimeloyl-ACP methyl ester carboxylesterase
MPACQISIIERTAIFHCSIDKVPKVTSPVLVIHGTEDEVIDFSHGLAMYERCPRAVEPLWVEVGQKCLFFSYQVYSIGYHSGVG